MDEASEEVAVEIAAQGVLGKRVDEMESGFMMALDYMIQLADNDQDDKVLNLQCYLFAIAKDSYVCFTMTVFSAMFTLIGMIFCLQRKSLLEVIKDTILSYLTKKCPPHVCIFLLVICIDLV